MRPQGRLRGRLLRHPRHRDRGGAGHFAPAGERVLEHAGGDRATLLEARRPRAVGQHDRRRGLPAAARRALGMGHAHHARVSPRSTRPLAGRAQGHRGGRRVHVRHLHGLARELPLPAVPATDLRGHDARLAHGRVPVSAALSGDVLRRGVPHAHPAVPSAPPGDTTKPHPLFGDRELRRALAMAADRGNLLHNVFGDMAKVPPGPMSQLLWIWDPEIRELPHDSARAARTLARLGWTDSDGDGIRDREGHPLAFRLLVPTTSAVRRQYARLLQEQFRTMGIDVQLDEVDFSVFSERAHAGRFDALIAVWNTDPTPSSGIPQTWTRAGFGRSNYGRYENPVFGRLVDRAVTSVLSRDEARRTWRAAIETLNQDAPAVFLFATENVAAVHKRVADVRIRPDSWLALVRTLRIPADRLTDRDRVER